MGRVDLHFLEALVDRLAFLGTKLSPANIIGYINEACSNVGIMATPISVFSDPKMYIFGRGQFVLTDTNGQRRYGYVQEADDDDGTHIGYNIFCVKNESDRSAYVFVPVLDNGNDHTKAIAGMFMRSFGIENKESPKGPVGKKGE